MLKKVLQLPKMPSQPLLIILANPFYFKAVESDLEISERKKRRPQTKLSANKYQYSRGGGGHKRTLSTNKQFLYVSP